MDLCYSRTLEWMCEISVTGNSDYTELNLCVCVGGFTHWMKSHSSFTVTLCPVLLMALRSINTENITWFHQQSKGTVQECCLGTSLPIPQQNNRGTLYPSTTKPQYSQAPAGYYRDRDKATKASNRNPISCRFVWNIHRPTGPGMEGFRWTYWLRGQKSIPNLKRELTGIFL